MLTILEFMFYLQMPVVVIGGVTAVGKTSTAKRLKELYNWDYIEADEYHPESNISKMRAGIPLKDEDRLPWLIRLHEVLRKYLSTDQNCIITCSALKKFYRHILLTGSSDLNVKPTVPTDNFYLIMLTLSREDLHDRLIRRQHVHFMNPVLLDSQLETLELPLSQEDEPCTYVINCDDLSQDEVVSKIQSIIKQ